MRTLHLPAMVIQLAYVFAHGFGTNCFSALYHVKVEQKSIKIGRRPQPHHVMSNSRHHDDFVTKSHRAVSSTCAASYVQHHTETITCNRENRVDTAFFDNKPAVRCQAPTNSPFIYCRLIGGESIALNRPSITVTGLIFHCAVVSLSNH